MEVTMNRYYLITIFLMFSALLTGCASVTKTDTSLGGIKESDDVTSSYESYAINPDFIYYYYGPELEPDAIMGIRKEYDVQSKFWKPVSLTKEQLRYWVKWGKRENSGESFSRRYSGYQGAYILDPRDNVIGDWYSKKDMGVFDFPGDRVVIPYPPTNQGGSPNKPCD